jgi:hypothetical protein
VADVIALTEACAANVQHLSRIRSTPKPFLWGNLSRNAKLIRAPLIWKPIPMPYFSFDLVLNEEFKDQGGMILENTEVAFEKAESLASELSVVRPDLRSRGCAVRVTDYDKRELYRTPLDPVP